MMTPNFYERAVVLVLLLAMLAMSAREVARDIDKKSYRFDHFNYEEERAWKQSYHLRNWQKYEAMQQSETL